MSHQTFRNRLRAGDTIAGSFLKTPSSICAEIMALTDFDVICIDAEHAPFGCLETDQCIAAMRAQDMPCLVRIGSDSPHDICNALDSGATGIVVPHVKTAAQAAAIVDAAHFAPGHRGYAGSPRAAGYTTLPMQEYLARSREETTVIVQIEDLEALDNVAEIAAVEGIDALFIGRVDLAVAMEQSVSAAPVLAAIEGICEAARDFPPAVGMFTPNADEVPGWIDKGASLFLLGSDHGFMLAGANELARKIKA